MPAFNFPTGAATGGPIAVPTSLGTIHTTRTAKKSEVSILVFNNDSSTDYNFTLAIGGTTIGVIKIEKLNSPYQVLPPIMLDAGVTIGCSTTVAGKLYALVQVAEYD